MSEANTQRHAQHQKRALPAYIATFADLMSLLMCFFVLLLSFAEIDAMKFKMVVDSLEKAFGVQRDVPAIEIPMGTSIIAQEFSPGEPRPTPINVVQQQTIDDPREVLKVTMDAEAAAQEIARQTAEEAEKFKQALQAEIADGLIEVENQENRIVIRIREKGSFPSGDAQINTDFIPILKTIHDVLLDTDGLIAVAGHTDNIPINTSRYRSNWELSSSRATSVVHELLTYQQLSPDRLMVEGYADTRPLMPNDSPTSRAQNRRVEIVVLKSLTVNDTTHPIESLRETLPAEGGVTVAP
ncbi:Flagellar motor rotation protein MotB [Methylophaga frappieri]|uniref:Flagellar motor rotation protein MotB n=1 Tax=Methylophaga frappieri (strain ATCC BAA-2434 / DSM 25690 / JAM7) TaxID=754477 RepID=I1YL47_METFJ|nr:flagellar motor protein MotB [Methylophaga frappieri]AFJ03640.1 Flagellar motor rotation protein MotB [Methylophaga frappieri]